MAHLSRGRLLLLGVVVCVGQQVEMTSDVCDHSALLQRKLNGSSMNAKIEQHEVRKTGLPPIGDIGDFVNNAFGHVAGVLDLNTAFEKVQTLVDSLADFVDQSIQKYAATAGSIKADGIFTEVISNLEYLKARLTLLQEGIHEGFQSLMAVTEELLPSGTKATLINLVNKIDNASTDLTNSTVAVIDRIAHESNATAICSKVHTGMAILQAEVDNFMSKISEFGTERFARLIENLPELLAEQISTAVQPAIGAVDHIMARVPQSMKLLTDAVDNAVDDAVCKDKDAAWRPAFFMTFLAAVLMHMGWL